MQDSIIIIIIIIGSPFSAFLKIFYQICHLGFIYLNFAKKLFFQSKFISLGPIANLEGQVPLFMSPSERVKLKLSP
jgi:hypothetical protein